jgi:hypothetical protein
VHRAKLFGRAAVIVLLRRGTRGDERCEDDEYWSNHRAASGMISIMPYWSV